jgi:ATP-dependent DNA helicase RecG
VLDYEERKIIRIFVTPSSDVHSYKNVIYDRAGASNIRITATRQIAAFYIRKQKIYNERRIYPYVHEDHLRLDLLPRIRQMAVNYNIDHPWKNMTDTELLNNAGLIGEDLEIGKKGFNFAAIMLLGKDELIRSISSTYRTDAIVRKVNVDRYDDRLIVQTNLIESYEQLMQFAEKHLWDKFYLDGDVRINLRNAIAREMLVNTLIHRDFFSDYIPKFIIEKDRMLVENGNHTITNTVISLENFQPNAKNPIIASFFRNIGLADELGSGVRNLYHYVKRYSGKDPELIDGDIFRIIIPLDENYTAESKMDMLRGGTIFYCGVSCSSIEIAVLEHLQNNPTAPQQDVATFIGKSLRTTQNIIKDLKDKGLLSHEGSKKKGFWIVKKEEL